MQWSKENSAERKTEDIEIRQRRFESNEVQTSILFTSQTKCDQYPRKKEQQKSLLAKAPKNIHVGQCFI